MIFDPADQNISDQVNRDLAEQHAQGIAAQWGFPYVHLGEYPVNLDMLRLFSKAQSQGARIFAFDRKIKTVRLATYEPKQNEAAQQLIAALKAQNYEVAFYFCSQESFNEALQKYDSELLHRKTMDIKQSFDEQDVSLSSIKRKFQALKPDLKEQTISGVVTEIELLSLEAEASDIHWQPNLQGDLVVRIRVDGVLHDMLQIPRFLAPKFVTKIKYDAGMKSNITEHPQDGRIRLQANNRTIELRVSTLPMEYCESVVIRLSDRLLNWGLHQK
jgi:MSHA biogenesis protein MshE